MLQATLKFPVAYYVAQLFAVAEDTGEYDIAECSSVNVCQHC